MFTLTKSEEDFSLVEIPVSESNLNYDPSFEDKVLFQRVRDAYNFNETLYCFFSFETGKPLPGDIIGIIKQKSPHNVKHMICSATVDDNIFYDLKINICGFCIGFEGNKLPKDSMHYNFVYIRKRVSLACSEPFVFFSNESKFIEVEDPNDPGLVIFKSRIDKLNERIEQLHKENVDLAKKLQDEIDTNKTMENELCQKVYFEDSPRNRIIQDESPRVSAADQTSLPYVGWHEAMQKLNQISSSVTALHNTIASTGHFQTTKLVNKLSDLVGKSHHNADFSDDPLCGQSSRDSLLENIGDNLVKKEPEMEQQASDENLKAMMNYFKERNAALMSRVSVLELELQFARTNTAGALLDRIDSLEVENAKLTQQLEESTKMICNLESLNDTCKKLRAENNIWKLLVDQQQKNVHLNSSQIKKISNMEKELAILISQRDQYEFKLTRLRQELIGIVTMEQDMNFE